MSDLTDDSIKEICSRMNVLQLKNFIQTTHRNYTLCSGVLEQKKIFIKQQLEKYFLKAKILNAMNKLEDLYDVIDLTYMDLNGNGIKTVVGTDMLYPQGKRVSVPGYPLIYTSPRYVDKILNIMNTEDPRQN